MILLSLISIFLRTYFFQITLPRDTEFQSWWWLSFEWYNVCSKTHLRRCLWKPECLTSGHFQAKISNPIFQTLEMKNCMASKQLNQNLFGSIHLSWSRSSVPLSRSYAVNFFISKTASLEVVGMTLKGSSRLHQVQLGISEGSWFSLKRPQGTAKFGNLLSKLQRLSFSSSLNSSS